MALRLIITQGPRRGETLEFPPGSVVRLGRLVRGNNLTIRDSGISSNHLRIGSDSDPSRWVLHDLETSNGTFVNGNPVLPDSPVEIRSGDVVKLGERTSIIVEISDADAGDPGPTRGPARRARVSSSKAEEEKVAAKPESTRRTRTGKREDNAASCLVLEEIPENFEENPEGEIVVAKKAITDTQRRKNLRKKPPECVVIDMDDDRDNANTECVVNGNACGVTESSNGVEKGNRSGLNENSDGFGKDLDLEKMSFEEWVDYLEVQFRKQIEEATEEMTKEMRLKAKRVREYMVEQKNEKPQVIVV